MPFLPRPVFSTLCAALTAVAMQSPASAASAEGSVELNGKAVRISHVVAQLHDNAEGVVKSPLMIVFADRPVPAGALDGAGAATALQQLARAGQLRGLLLRMDPARPNESSFVLLDKADDPRAWMASMTQSDQGVPVVAGMKLGPTSVSGTMKRQGGGDGPVTLGYALKFDAPVAREPAITADLKGADLRSSPQYKVAAAYADAMAKGDAAAVRKLSSPAMAEITQAMFDSAGAANGVARMKQGAAYSKAQLGKFVRLVERGPRAMLIVDGYEYVSFVKDGQDWKLGS